MVAAVRGYHMILPMPDNMSEGRRGAMRAFGAEIRPIIRRQGMAYAGDLALALDAGLDGATIVFIVRDRVDRYLSTGVFPA